MNNTILELIQKEKFITIARGVKPELLSQAVEAVYKGGVKLMEFTFNQSSENRIREIQDTLNTAGKQMGDKMRFGVGTVLNVDEVRAAADAGAEYMISPNTNFDVIKETKKLGLVSIPGAMSPTEIMNAWNSGADLVKLFPADDLGFHYIRNIRAPLNHIPLIATGGVNPETIPQFLDCGVAGMGAGITILKPDLLESRNFAEITKLASLHVQAIKEYSK